MKKTILLLSVLAFCVMSAKTVKNNNLNITEKSVKMQKTEAPGYFRFMLGNYEITSIYDGYTDMDLTTYIGENKGKKEELLRKEFAYLTANSTKSSSKISINTFLINTKDELILVDAGSGNSLGPTLGLVEKNIVASGYKAEDVNKILLTHLHPDHILGLTIDGKIIYPNATIYVNKEESEYWLSEKNYTKEIKAALEPYIKNKQYKTFDNGSDNI